MLRFCLLSICLWLCLPVPAGNLLTADRITVEQGLPSNNVNDILQDPHGYIWMATDNGLCRYDGGSFINFSAMTNANRAGLTDNRIVSLSVDDKRQRLFIRSFAGTYSCFDLVRGCFIPCSPKDASHATPRTPHWKTGLQRPSSHFIYAIHDNGQEARFPLSQVHDGVLKRSKVHASETADGKTLYLTLADQIYRVDSKESRIKPLSGITRLLPPRSTVSCILVDLSGTLWVCSRYCGVTKISQQHLQADYLLPNPNENGQEANNVRLVKSAGQGHILVSTKDGQLMDYDTTQGLFTNRTRLGGNTYAYLQDSRHRTWIGTKGDGLYVDGVCYSPKNRNIPLRTPDIYDLAEDTQGRIWIASYGSGLIMAETMSDGRLKFTPYLTDDLRKSRVRKVAIDCNLRLWVGTNNGLYIIDTRKKVINEGQFYFYDMNNSGLPDRDVLSVVFDKHGKVWIATYAGGLAYCSVPTDYGHIRLKTLTQKDGLPNNNIRIIIEDRHGYLWLGTDNGLACLSPATLHVNEYKLGKDMLANSFSENAAALLPDGDLLLGTAYGLWRIRPAAIPPSDSKAPTITSLTVNGRKIFGGTDWTEAIRNKAVLTFNHEENAIEFHFSNFDYAQLPHYRYYLEPLEKSWHNPTTHPSAFYGHLKPGRYTFHVQVYKAAGYWSKISTINICIREHWYNTWWMWTLYFCIMAGIVFIIARMLIANLHLRNSIKIEKGIMAFRIDFFTHIAHEFRTPIAIIRTAIDAMGQTGNNQREQQAHNLRAARRGTNRLARLVDNLLLFRKLNEGYSQLQVSKGNIVEYLQQIYTDFFPYADSRSIKLQMILPAEKELYIFFDPEKVEIIFSNILSNAIKYAPEKSSVVIRIKNGTGVVNVSVADEGPGIDAKRRASLFKPFMQGMTSAGGMGIGLYLAHTLASCHHGSLTYSDNNEAGHGAVFTFSLPTGSQLYTPDEMVSAISVTKQDNGKQATEPDQTLLPDVCDNPINQHVKVYLVEDDTDMVSQMNTMLSIYFTVCTFCNGKEALDALGNDEIQPRIIISDVMMPVMNGLELTKAIKQQKYTRHIGIILLSALDTETSRMQAVKAGADDFFVKPCPLQMLVARCFRLIQNQQPQAGAKSQLPQSEIPIVESLVDKNFKDKVENIVAAHLSDDSFTVDILADQLGWGRSVVYRRVKQLLGMTPNDYIRSKRMERAARLIVEGGHTIAEVSLMVGIKDPAYFNRCFKKQFGVTPSKYGR